MVSQTLEAVKRNEKGKNFSRRLRANGMIPAVVYSHGKSESIAINAKSFGKIFKNHISESMILKLAIEGSEDCEVFVKDYQRDPLNDNVMHLDFFKITAGEKIYTTVQLDFIGSPIGVKKGGAFEQIERELAVEVLPRDLPEKLIIDVTNLDIHDSIKVSDIEKPESMSFAYDDDHVVAHVVTIKVVEEEAEEEELLEAEEEAPEEDND